MWTRKKLKDRAKFALRQNYWKIVLVALMAGLLVGSGGAYSGYGRSHRESKDRSEKVYQETSDMGVRVETGLEEEDSAEDMQSHIEELNRTVDENWPFIIVVVIAMIVIILLAIILVVILDAFILNPFEVGAKRFFSHSIVQKAEVKEIAYGYDHSYQNVAKIMFLKDLYTVLWTLLFIIPGIVKSYEYQMIPYLLGEHPEMSTEEAFATSRELMHGNKWKAFVLDLSFLGWGILSVLTIGILAIFYVMPYIYLTKAALYRELMGYDRVVPAQYQEQRTLDMDHGNISM